MHAAARGAAAGPRVLCVVNQKGGVGKTTTAVNLAASVGAAEKRTLLLDMDPQGNASSGVGVRPGTTERSVYDVLIGRSTLDEVLVPTEIKHLFVAPATQDLVAAELELVDDPQRATRLLDAVKSLTTPFDYIFIDCPPALGILTLNALVASAASDRAASVRVLRAGRDFAADGHDRSGEERHRSTPTLDARRDRAHHVRPPQ